MNPHQIAKAHCDNYQTDGSCLGANIADDLTIKSCTPRPVCLLALNPIKRCQHFEECIMPYKIERNDKRLEAKLKSEFEEGIRIYRMTTGAMTTTDVKLCPQCRKNKIPTSRKLCEICKEENRRSAYTKQNQQRK